MLNAARSLSLMNSENLMHYVGLRKIHANLPVMLQFTETAPAVVFRGPIEQIRCACVAIAAMCLDS